MSASTRNFIFCVHAHQPVGNFDWIIKKAYDLCYKPFFETLEKYPNIKLCAHFSGSLMDWLVLNQPEFIDQLKKLSNRGQVEFLGGAYYEPIYGAIPQADLLGQIQKMSETLKLLYGSSPKGAWLTERVWDPKLTKILSSAGLSYTVLDDFHIMQASERAPVTNYYQVGEEGSSLDLFASMKALRYLIPFAKPKRALDYVRSLNLESQSVAVFADDIEKFGFWPTTHSWVYDKKWLDQFFSQLENSADVKTYTFSEFRKNYKFKKTVEIPHASYQEMMEWSGGRFYNFFDKYYESQYMSDRATALSQELSQNQPSLDATNSLYKAQCNCAYWHGVFGGVYFHHLRSAVFENIIQAEQLLSKDTHKPVLNQITLNSGARFRLAQENLTCFFDPSYGAALEEADYLPKKVNLMCNLKRYPEAYHPLLTQKKANFKDKDSLSIYQILGFKERGLEKHIFYDSFKRLSFMDHFFQDKISLAEFKSARYHEVGDFMGELYLCRSTQKPMGLACERLGSVRLSGQAGAIKLTKTFLPDSSSGISAHYVIKNEEPRSFKLVFGVEFNFSIGENNLAKGLARCGIKKSSFYDTWRGISIDLCSDRPMDLLAFPVETVSESEEGLGRTTQAMGVLLQENLTLEPNDTQEFLISLKVSHQK